MKTLIDGTKVSSRTYYYLLDWNDADSFNYLTKVIEKPRLCECNIKEYRELFDYATKTDLNKII